MSDKYYNFVIMLMFLDLIPICRGYCQFLLFPASALIKTNKPILLAIEIIGQEILLSLSLVNLPSTFQVYFLKWAC